jgi:hypothetical protein
MSRASDFQYLLSSVTEGCGGWTMTEGESGKDQIISMCDYVLASGANENCKQDAEKLKGLVEPLA